MAFALCYLTILAFDYHGDAYLYWSTPVGSYPTSALTGFLYTPPVMLAMAPIHLLSWPVFYALWTAALIGGLYWMAGPWVALVLMVPGLPGWHAVASGNIATLIGIAVVLGLQGGPGAWAWPILTKLTPGVGLVWFMVRREWGRLAIALGVTAACVAVSWVLAPDMWAAWFGALRLNATTTAAEQGFNLTAIPLWIRVAVASFVVALAGRRGAAWAVPIAVCYALPWVAATAWPVALGAVRLSRSPASRT